MKPHFTSFCLLFAFTLVFNNAFSQCSNVALGKPATASGIYLANIPADAVDGVCNGTGWISGQFAPAWIQVDLQGAFTINQINLQTDMSPNGFVSFNILTAPNISGPYSVADVFSGNLVNGQIIQRCYSTSPLANVGAIRIETVTSPSWVSWYEIEALSVAAPTISASGPLSFCQDDSVTLTSSQADSYLWSTGDTTQSIVVKNSGSYTITVNQNSCLSGPSTCSQCGSSAAVSVSVNSCTPVPALSQWRLIISGLLVLFFGAISIVRFRTP